MKTVDVKRGDKFPLFNTIAIESAALCNRACVFCPNHTTERPDEQMPMELIEKIVDELAALKYKGVIQTFIYNEPTRDKRLPKILELFNERIPGASICMSTNGDYLKSAKDVERWFDLGVRQLIINIYSAADGCGNARKEERGVEAAAKRHAQVQKWLDDLGVDQKSGMYNHAPKGARRARVEAKYGVIGSDKKIGAQFGLTNRAGNIDWFKPPAEPLAKMCVKPFRFLNINWKGDAIVCCNDYHGETAFGNVRDKTIEELWNSLQMNIYREHLQRKDRNIPLCVTCDDNGGFYQHNVAHVINVPGSKKK